MTKLYLLFFYVFSMYFCYEFAFKSGVEVESYNSYISYQKTRNCLEVIANGR